MSQMLFLQPHSHWSRCGGHNTYLTLSVPAGMFEEASTKHSLIQQVGDHPLRVIAVVVAIGAATIVPVLRQVLAGSCRHRLVLETVSSDL